MALGLHRGGSPRSAVRWRRRRGTRDGRGTREESLPLRYRLRLWGVFLGTWFAGREVIALIETYYPGAGPDIETHLLLALAPGSLLAPLAVWWYRRRLTRRAP